MWLRLAIDEAEETVHVSSPLGTNGNFIHRISICANNHLHSFSVFCVTLVAESENKAQHELQSTRSDIEDNKSLLCHGSSILKFYKGLIYLKRLHKLHLACRTLYWWHGKEYFRRIKKKKLLFMILKSCGMLTLQYKNTEGWTYPYALQGCCDLSPLNTRGNWGLGRASNFLKVTVTRWQEGLWRQDTL